jgi:uncharacterized membrane protein (DUF485 family)
VGNTLQAIQSRMVFIYEHWSSMGSSENEKVWVETQASPEFQALKRKFRNYAFPVAALSLAWYFLYVLLTGFARDFINTKLFGNINLAFLLGLLQFVTTFGIAWAYDKHSTKHLDDASDKIAREVEGKLSN